jgi:integrase
MTTSVKLKKKPSKVEGKRMPLYFQIISHRVVKRIVLDLELAEEEWAAKSESINLPPGAGRKRVEQLLQAREVVERHRRQLTEVITQLEEKGELTAGQIVASYRAKVLPVSFPDYMQTVIEKKKSIRSEATIRNYQSTRAVFSAFLQSKAGELPVNGIDKKLLKEFEQSLLARHLSANTISFYFRILNTVWNQAVADGLIEKQPSPFHEVCTNTAKTRKRAVDEEVIKKLEAFPSDATSGLSFARDLFLFCYYARGMAFVDLAYLTPEHIKGKTLTYIRRKTGQELTIELLPVMLELIRKYRKKGQKFLFPILHSDSPTFREYTSALRLYNKWLKKLGKLIGFNNLSSYVARHSWASVAFKRGINVDIISEGMGHTSVKTTYIYIASLDNTRIDRANKAVVMGKQQYKSIYRSGVL